MTAADARLNPVYDIMGKKLDGLNLACEMMMFSFEGFELHAQGFVRVIKDGEILTTTLDYQNWDGETDTNNDLWHFIGQTRESIVGGRVESVEISSVNDLLIRLDNGVRIEALIANGRNYYGEESNQWMFFRKHDYEYPFITVRSRSVDGVTG